MVVWLKKERKRKMKKLHKLGGLALGVAVIMAFAGCSTMPVAFSDKSIPMEQGKYTVVGDEVMGEDHQVMILGFGLGLPGSGQRRALKQALDQAPSADALISMAVDVQVINLMWASVVTTKVTGTPVKTNNAR